MHIVIAMLLRAASAPPYSDKSSSNRALSVAGSVQVVLKLRPETTAHLPRDRPKIFWAMVALAPVTRRVLIQ